MMTNLITNPTLDTTPRSIFNVITSSGHVIASSVPYWAAFRIAKAHPNARIKFSRILPTTLFH